jgi:hypothetical protein
MFSLTPHSSTNSFDLAAKIDRIDRV